MNCISIVTQSQLGITIVSLVNYTVVKHRALNRLLYNDARGNLQSVIVCVLFSCVLRILLIAIAN